MTVKNHPERQQFILPLPGGEPARIDYRTLPDGTLELQHTEVPRAERGHGIGPELVRQTMEIARREGFRIIPSCPFIAQWVRRHPEYRDVIAQA